LARPGSKLARRDPVRQVLRRLLLEEDLARDAVRIALHRERPVPQVRDERHRNLLVVREHVSLGDLVVRIEDAVGGAQLDSLRFTHCVLPGLVVLAGAPYAERAAASCRHSSGVPAATTRERPRTSSGAAAKGGSSKRSIARPR